MLLAKPEPLTEDELLHAAELVEAAGGREWAESEADAALASAGKCLAGTGHARRRAGRVRRDRGVHHGAPMVTGGQASAGPAAMAT